MTTEEEIAKILAGVLNNRSESVAASSNRRSGVDRRRSAGGKYSLRRSTEEEEEQFRTYIRANTVTNVAEVDTRVMKDAKGNPRIGRDGEVMTHSSYIDITAHSIPSKAQVKRAASRKRRPISGMFGVGVGSSRSTLLDRLKAIHAAETGSETISLTRYRSLRVHMWATTARGSLTSGMQSVSSNEDNDLQVHGEAE